MTLIQEIIDQAVDEKASFGTLLRRCLVLEQQIKNEKFRQWLNWELDGYVNSEEMRSYRKFRCINKGLFLGMVVRMNDQPIQMHVLSKSDREAMELVELRQPVASYTSRPAQDTDAHTMWPQWLVTKYQAESWTEDSGMGD